MRWIQERQRDQKKGVGSRVATKSKFLRAIPLWMALVIPGFAEDWPQWLGPQRDAVWHETGIMESFRAGGPPLRWKTSIGSGYSGPAVADGRVFVMDRVKAEADPNEWFNLESKSEHAAVDEPQGHPHRQAQGERVLQQCSDSRRPCSGSQQVNSHPDETSRAIRSPLSRRQPRACRTWQRTPAKRRDHLHR